MLRPSSTFWLAELFTLLYSSKCTQFEDSSTLTLPALVQETNLGKRKENLEESVLKNTVSDLDQQLLAIYPSFPLTTEGTQTVLDYQLESSLISSESSLLEDFDSFIDMALSSSSPFVTSAGTLTESLQVTAEENVAQSSAHQSQLNISKTIFLSHLPVTVNDQWLRTFFPGCVNINFKKNHWNKNLRL